ncbi:DUF4870 domain-containing protein [Dictyobacter aurantiacus]|uniref:DUF4870 domain-containing protein n=1 Tax=Dictyobacter aurantiacus TaxID=1936993 RepID=A0A401ZG84_9CHLR|nr:hypothetical protein [Dictyobacter aurantiacus]GCE05900.1 hypothetical protein KDAU_32290 [Dictyobacter aurantiacus]
MQQSYRPVHEHMQQEQNYHNTYTTGYAAPQLDPQHYEQQFYSGQPGNQASGPAQPVYPAIPLFNFAFMRQGPTAEAKLAAVVSYLGGWLTGMLLLLFVKDNRFIRFHAMQSLLFFGGYTVFFVAFLRIIEAHLFLLSGFAIFAFVLMHIIAAIGWFVGVISALSGKYTRLPFVGDRAERFVNGSTPGTVK